MLEILGALQVPRVGSPAYLPIYTSAVIAERTREVIAFVQDGTGHAEEDEVTIGIRYSDIAQLAFISVSIGSVVGLSLRRVDALVGWSLILAITGLVVGLLQQTLP
jgi:hypothetical protein